MAQTACRTKVGPSEVAAKWEAMSDSNTLANGLSGFVAGDRSARLRENDPIVRLYDELRPSLFGYLICQGLMPQEADDIIQDSFVQLYRVHKSNGNVDNPRSWLFRVAHNLSVNLQKRERRLVPAIDGEPYAGLEGVRVEADPEQIYAHKERMRLLATAVTRLPQRQRECLYLRAEGLRYREIAEVIGTTTSAVAESLKRAVMRLMDDLYE